MEELYVSVVYIEDNILGPNWRFGFGKSDEATGFTARQEEILQLGRGDLRAGTDIVVARIRELGPNFMMDLIPGRIVIQEIFPNTFPGYMG